MVRTITKIKDISVLSQGDNQSITSISSINFDDKEIGAGGFGKIHNILSIDGIQSEKYVIKIYSDMDNASHGYDTIEKLHLKLKKNEHSNNIPTYIEHPELLGLPFLALKGYDEIEEVAVTAFVMFDLNELGFIDYGSESSDNLIYRALELQDKIFIGHQLAHCVAFLHSLKYINSDLKEAAIWYHPHKKQLAIIDYDSGYHYDTQEKPTTLGAIGQWISGSLRNIINSNEGDKERSVKERLNDEYWVLANALFELMFDVMPYFFLRDSDDSTKKKYLKKNKWPKIDEKDPEFISENKSHYDELLRVLESLKEAGLSDLVTNFSTIFNDGYSNSSKRISANEWASFLKNLTESLGILPSIENFSPDKSTISQKDEVVTVSFNTNHTRYISIDNQYYSPILHKTASIICKTKENQIKLIAYNLIGNLKEQLNINAQQRAPIIKEFNVSKLIRDTEEPLTLSWKTDNVKRITISNVEGEFEGNSQIQIEPKSKTIYKLSAFGYFDELLEKEITVDIIKPRIKRFDWEINLNEGIDNVDLMWDTENTKEIRIDPKVGVQAIQGKIHIPIREETIFTLTAIGIFTSVTEEIKAHPFPAPIIKQLFVETPKMNISTKIESVNLNSFKGLEIPIGNLNAGISFLKTLELPKFETQNSLIDSFENIDSSSKALDIHALFKRIKTIINQSQ